MNVKSSFKKSTIIIVVCIVIGSFFCSEKNGQDEIQKIITNPNITDEESLYKISHIIFGNSLKSFTTEKNSSGKQDVTIEYGGNRAFTFYSDGNYSERIQFDTVRYILLYFQAGQKRNLDSLRISVVKPYFVKEPDAKKEVMEEFEVFRVNITLAEISKVVDWENSKLLSDKKSVNNGKTIELFNQVRLHWKIELNELSRIELK